MKREMVHSPMYVLSNVFEQVEPADACCVGFAKDSPAAPRPLRGALLDRRLATGGIAADQPPLQEHERAEACSILCTQLTSRDQGFTA